VIQLGWKLTTRQLCLAAATARDTAGVVATQGS
jgi:hypothetical protein